MKKIAALILPLCMNGQCAMCRSVLASSNNITVAKGINNGITYLMILPYLLVVVLGFLIYIQYRKSSS